jgi:hypothetical protein
MFFFEEIVMPPLMTAVDIGAMLLEGHVDPFEDFVLAETQPKNCSIIQ